MFDNVTLAAGATKLVRVCGRVHPGESVLIVTDYAQDPAIPGALAVAATAAGAVANLVLMPSVGADSSEPSPAVAAAMRAADVIFTPVTVSITHTLALRAAVDGGARAVVLSGFTRGMMVRGGITADFEAIAPHCEAVARALGRADRVHLTSPGGTDLRFDATGRVGIAKTGIAGPHDFTPVPDIEAAIAPVEGTAEGMIVADLSIPYLGIGRPDRPVTLTVERGMIVAVDGGSAAETVRRSWAAMNDPKVYNIAELGIGLNPECRLTGNMLEDEGILGAVHIGTGTNITLGGNTKAACHYDFLMKEATVRADGDIVVLERGRVPDAIWNATG